MNGIVPAIAPIIIPPMGSTKPQAGVMTTRPATAPEQNPTTVALPLRKYSMVGQTKEAIAVASVVVVKALEETTSAAQALPALKPYQPTQSREAPMKVRTVLWGAKWVLPQPIRLPRIRASTRPEYPEGICTTVPPAKSIAGTRALGCQTPLKIPSIPQTQ